MEIKDREIQSWCLISVSNIIGFREKKEHHLRTNNVPNMRDRKAEEFENKMEVKVIGGDKKGEILGGKIHVLWAEMADDRKRRPPSPCRP